MNRNLRDDAVVLRTHPIGEIHKGVVLFTRHHGIIHAIAHGAAKGRGKLRGTTSPFNRGRVYLYYEPVRRSYKITDMEASDYFPGLRQDLVRYYSASLWAEVLLKSHGGGADSERLFRLLHRALAVLDGSDETPARLLSVQFLWRYLEITGYQPELHGCTRCGRMIPDTEGASFSAREGGFICRSCGNPELPVLSAGARRYLAFTATLPLERAARVGLDDASRVQLTRMLYEFVQDVIESPLKTLASGDGIL
jgi:DNA repair protein RecO (recombination protein O)